MTRHIETVQRNGGTLKESVVTWIEEASDEIRHKLQSVGLILVPDMVTVGELWERFLAIDRGVKKSTIEVYQHARNRFLKYFPLAKNIAEITREDIEAWRDESLKKQQGFASATVCATLSKAITVFNFAVKRGWIDKSPLRGVSIGTTRNPANDRFVHLDEINKILAACSNQTWRVIVTLARFGGLRPSEIKLLRWCDIGKNTFLVTSPKTAHHAGGESRRCALFVEIERELDALHAMSGAGGNELIADPKQHRLIGIQSLAAKLIKKAGLLPIPRFFDNCRHSRSIELRNDPSVGAWASAKMLGHSLKVADSNYSGIREEDYERIAKKVTQSQQNLSRYAANNPITNSPAKTEEKLLVG